MGLTFLTYQFQVWCLLRENIVADRTGQGGSWSIHRADLHQALLSRLGENTHIHLSSRVTACREEGDAATLELQNGRTASFDLVVGADGVWSVIRRDFLKTNFPSQDKYIHPLWSGSIGYRGLIPREVLAQKAPGHRAISTPIMASLRRPLRANHIEH